MSVTAQEILEFAKTLSCAPLEVAHRSSVSRAYYASYHACLVWAGNFPVPGSNAGLPGGVHQIFINQLRNPASGSPPDAAKKSRILSAMLDVMRNQRKLADYTLASNNIDSAVAQTVCANAANILNKASVFP